MKTTPRSILHHVRTAAFAVALVATSSSLHAAAFTWVGASTASWGTSTNWSGGVAPTFTNTDDLVFPTSAVTNTNMVVGGTRTVRSMDFGSNVTSPMFVNFQNFSFGTGANFTLGADSNNASITIASNASGNITVGTNSANGSSATNFGILVLATNLNVVHNGTGILLFNRAITNTGGSFGITKSGTGTMILGSIGSSPNTFLGDINVNEGTLIANGFVVATDMNNAANLNLGGGTVVIANVSGADKNYSNVAVRVTNASTLAWSNTGAATFTLSFSGTNLFALSNNLTVRNSSTNAALTNAINISRALSGSGDLTNIGYNNLTAPTNNYNLGRLFLSGTNTNWNGNLVIARGAVTFGGNGSNSLGNGTIILGATGDSFGAGLGGFVGTNIVPGNTTITFTNPIIVRSGGFRSINIGSDQRFNFTGNITLEGSLNVNSGTFFNDRIFTFAGNISGVGGLDFTRGIGGAINLTGSNSYSGPTTISNGADLVANSASGSAIGDLSAVTISGFATATNQSGGTNSRLRIATSETIGSLASVGTTADLLISTNAVLTTGGDNASTTYAGNSAGAGGLTKAGTGTMTLDGTNSYTGNTVVDGGQLVLGTNASLRFVIGGNGTNNAVSGVGSAFFQGTFNIDLTTASTNDGDSWTLVSVAVPAYDGGFQVAGFTNSGGDWSLETNGITYTFAQSNNVLTVLNTNLSAYESWVAYWQGLEPGFTNTAGTDNPDGDPFNNDNEFAFDGNPAVGSPALLKASKVGTNSLFSWVQRNSGVTYQVQGTTNLTVAWTNTTGLTISNSADQSGLLGDDYTRVEFETPANGAQFHRVQATFTP